MRPDSSPVAVTDSQGAVLTSRLYAPFGETEEQSQPRYSYPRGFAGYLQHRLGRDAPEVLDAGYRLYAPAHGRFLGPDPVPIDTEDPRTADRFTYSFNDPIRYTDPDGRLPILAILGAFVLSTAAGVAIDYAIDPNFQFGHSLLINAGVSAFTGGLGHLAKLGKLGKLGARFANLSHAGQLAAITGGYAAIDAAVTYPIDRLYGRKTSLTNLLAGSVLSQLGLKALGALGRRALTNNLPDIHPRGQAAIPSGHNAAARRAHQQAAQVRSQADPTTNRPGNTCRFPRCLAQGTTVQTPNGPQPIETLRIGDRVTTPTHDHTPGLQITSKHRQIHLRIQHPKHGPIQATLLRPSQWLRQHGIQEGDTTDLTNLRYQGPTQVLAIQPAPTPAPGPGRLITGTYTLLRNDLRQLHLTPVPGQPPTTLTTTNDHPLFSEEQQAFVPAANLSPGNRLRTRTGHQTIATLQPLTTPQTVHDIEVDTDHVFYATKAELLVHNRCEDDPPEPGDANQGPPRPDDSAASRATAGTASTGRRGLSWKWRNVRRRLGRSGFAEKGQHVHHWLIPRGGKGQLTLKGFFQEQWGRFVPDIVKNRKWNLMPAPSIRWHQAVHGKGPMAYGVLGRIWHGSPTWFKVAVPVVGVGAGATAAWMMEGEDD